MNTNTHHIGYTQGAALDKARNEADERRVRLTVKGALLLCVAGPCIGALLGMWL